MVSIEARPFSPINTTQSSPRINTPANEVNIRNGVLEAVSSVFGIPEAEIIGRINNRTARDARLAALHLMGETVITLKDIGVIFDRRHSSTITYCLGKADEKMAIDPEFIGRVIQAKEITESTTIKSPEPPPADTHPSILRISKIVCDEYGISEAQLKGVSRRNTIVNVRRLLVLLLTKAMVKQDEMGKFLNRYKDTIRRIHMQAKRRLSIDQDFATEFTELQFVINKELTEETALSQAPLLL